MGFGTSNEYIAYAILDLARDEVRRYLANQGSHIINQYIEEANEAPVNSSENEKDNTRLISAVLATLESNNFNLKLFKNSVTNRLESILITFDENVKQLIELVRDGGKLSSVVISVFVVTDSMYTTANPFNMPTEVFIQYMFNRLTIQYYTDVLTDPDSTNEEKAEAQAEIDAAEIENQNLRSVYGVLVDSYDYDTLIQFLPNPLGMEERDFVTYMLNKKIWIIYNEGGDVSEEQYQEAIEDNTRLREKYRIKKDLYHYDQLKVYLPNPLGMTTQDFYDYYEAKKQSLDDYEIVNNPDSAEEEIEDALERIAEREQPFRNRYYISQDEDMTYDEMTQFIEENKIDLSDRLLFKIEVSLNYFKGKLETVDSKMIV